MRKLLLAFCVLCILSCDPAVALLDRVLIVGDSLTADTAMPQPSYLWTWKAANTLDWVHLVMARGCQTAGPSMYCCFGWCFGGAGTSYIKAIQDLFFDKMIIFLGTNDFTLGTTLEDFTSGYSALLSVWPEINTYCIIPPPRVDQDAINPVGLRLSDYRGVIRSVCTGAHRAVIETEAAMPLNGGYLAPDGVHLSAKGHTKIKELVVSAMR